MIVIALALLCAQNDICLLPNDAVHIEIWRQEDLSGRYLVDQDTSLNIPLLGRFNIQNIPIDSLHTLLINEFSNFYADVYVDITFYYRINVFGEVKLPGYYYVKSEDNLSNLLAQAGGPTEKGSLSGIRILNLGTERKIDFEEILKKGKDIEDLDLRPGDVVIVPRRFMPAFQEWSVFFSLGTLLLQVFIAVK
jgi:protein involved in polysaccharide export with SLBB domain